MFATQPAHAFKIVAPAEQAVLKAGQTVTAKVDLGNDPGVIKVRYYWYAEQSETLVEQEEDAAGAGSGKNKIADERYWQKDSTGGAIVALASLVATAQDSPPFGGKLRVPPDAIGAMRLLAVGEISRGRLGTRTQFDEILVQVQPEAELTSIEVETDKPLILGRTGQAATYGQVDSLGKIFDLPVVGLFADGVTRPIAHPSTGTAYQSSNDKVIKVLSGGMLQIVGKGLAALTVTNRGKQATLDVKVEVNDEPNEPPVADAGQNRTVKAGTKVKLSGLKSRDPEGEALFYSWSQVRGSKVALLDLNMAEASFLAPPVSEKRLYRFKLRVTDKQGADSLPAYVDVVVEP
ncbi:MAG: PKD domain-containing protein [Nitrospiraceae bacterium]